MSPPVKSVLWGVPPWRIAFEPAVHALPQETDVAIIGGGFTGLAAAAWLLRLAPEKSVTVFEAGCIGAGASRRTGGIALAETAAGDLPGLGDVLAGFREILAALHVDGDLHLGGVWEIGRQGASADSPIDWEDSGKLRVVGEVVGGSVDPGKLVSGRRGRGATRRQDLREHDRHRCRGSLGTRNRNRRAARAGAAGDLRHERRGT